MKINKITIERDSKIQEISLSVDDTKNLNFIVGGNASGKTRIFNTIKSYFLKETNESKTEICSEGGGFKNPDLMFVYENIWISKNLFENKKFSDEEKEKIQKKANDILHEFQLSDRIDLLQFKNEKIIPITNDGRVYQCAATEQYIVFLASLIAIRDVIEPNLPLILDSPFANISGRKRLDIIEMLSKNVNQVLVFLCDSEFTGTITADVEEFQSVELFVKEKNILGSLYLINNNTLEKYV